ncbi:cupin domain-containing protein [Micromonospora sp. MH33]|uniref:cupin domain-containing protein n=1 Tax=Micromonospora sp. MH33 TaxID=1945509 RepID=UPI0032B22ACC
MEPAHRHHRQQLRRPDRQGGRRARLARPRPHDEFFLVLDGELRIALRDGADGAEREVVLPRGAVFVVPRGVEHRPSAPDGASILMFEPSGTSSVGERHDEVPGHVDATTGHRL